MLSGTPTAPSALDIQILGGFRIFVDGHALERPSWRLRKAESLVKLLAATPGHRLHREQILEALWPEIDVPAGAAAFYQALHFARRALEPGLADARTSAFLHLEHNMIELRAPDRLRVDADDFDEAARAARRTGDLAEYRRAIDLYTGDLMPDDLYEDWASARREQLRRTCVDLLLELAQALQDAGDPRATEEALNRALQIEPTGENVHAALMSAYAAAGMRQRALQQYQRLCEILAQEVGAQPTPETHRLYEDIAAGRLPGPGGRARAATVRRQKTPRMDAAGARNTSRGNLPRQLTSFIGRRQEIADISHLIEQSPLVTLAGAAGAGKTRLAQETGAVLFDRHPHGAWWAALASLSEHSLVPKAVASALGVHEQTGRPVLDTLLEWLRGRHLLLILDNAEHLLAPCATFVDAVLQQCPAVRILVTSRQALQIAGEITYPVGPLSLPPARRVPSADALLGSEAVLLFVDRAAAVLPLFRLTDENAGVVLQICRRVDGIPLAIELAAARVRALSVQQIASRLDDQIGLLSDTRRTGLPRHQTLRATMEWSHQLLTTAERTLFRRLAPFAGGFTLETAEFVAAGSSLDAASILDVLGSLVLKSLVEVEDRGPEVRYRLLEPVRQYAVTKLSEAGEERRVRGRHRDFFLTLAERAHTGMTNPDRLAWLRQIDAEHGNIRGALRCSISAEEFDEAFQLGAAMARFWARRGFLEEGSQWLRELRRHESQVPEPARAGVWLGLGLLAFEVGEHVEALITEEALAVFRQAGDRDQVECCLGLLGMIENERGRFDRAATLLDEAIDLAAGTGDPMREAERLRQRGYVEVRRGNYHAAIPYLDRSLALLRGTGTRRSVGFGLGHLAQAYLYEGQAERAMAVLHEAMALVEAEEHSTAIAYFRNLLGLALLRLGDYGAAAEEYRKNLAYSAEIGHWWAAAQALIGIADGTAVRGELHQAARLLSAADAFLKATDYQLPLAEATSLDALLHRVRDSLDPGDFDVAWAAGASLTLKQAIQHSDSLLSTA